MAHYGEHLHLLVLALLGLVVLFLLFSLLPVEGLSTPVVYSIVIVLLAMFILSKFGGDLGRTL